MDQVLDPSAAGTLLVVGATFLLAGTVKGVIGLGLPTISLGILTAALGLEPAMALMLGPSFVTNLWQAMAGGHAATVLARTWPFLLTATLAVGIGAAGLPHLGSGLLSALLGLLLVCYAIVGMTRPALTLSPQAARRVWPVAGLLNGIFTGLTGSSVVPGVPYLQALGLPRDQLVQAMGALFAASAAALFLALAVLGRLTLDLNLLSLLAIVPALLGMRLGQSLRQMLSEARFRTLFFQALLVLGAWLVLRGFA